ncbi:MAG: fluoride efflux transporter CrcB [Bacteroidota bacterium]
MSTPPSLLVRVMLVAVGGALGALARYGTATAVLRIWTHPLPLATWAANLVGCLLIGVLTAYLNRVWPSTTAYYLLVVGFLGSYTTFSTFSLETVALWEQGHWALALVNSLGSVVLGILCAALGLYLGRLWSA